MVLDLHASIQKNTTSRYTKNFRVITRDNNSFVLTNIKGTEYQDSLTDNYIPLATDDVNGVCYIISAEVIDGIATGKGEIGTFPSPDYSNGNSGDLIYQYSPLMNYAGDDGSFPLMNGPFRSQAFNFDLVNLVDIELQNEYDGSINIVFTDGKNPMRIINSGFSVLPGDKFEIIDRAGNIDTNRYTISNFENTIQLIASSNKIMKIDFIECSSGGSLPTGTNQYFFSYGTSDGNETEIIGQSFNVAVFNGDKISNINGGKNTGDKTNKLVKFTLSNLDQSYAYVSVYFVRSEGMLSETRTAYRINQRYNITGSSMDFVHTGFEELINYSISDLTDQVSSIDTAGTITQADGHLLAADIREKTYNYQALQVFTRLIKSSYKQEFLDLIGPEDGMGRTFNETINQLTKKSGTDGWNGGYANPKNIYYKRGYWGGEGYAFMARYIFKDGSKSFLFPVSGIDNVNALNDSTLDSKTEAQLKAIDDAGGFSNDGLMVNTKGIYRFPNRNILGTDGLFRMVSNEGRITINGISFKIPSLTTDLGNGVQIKDITIGIQFFRGDRRPDVVMQGTMIDAMIVPGVPFDEVNTSQKMWDYNSGAGGYTEDNSKIIPTFDWILESNNEYDHYDTPAKRSSDTTGTGIAPYRFNRLNRNPQNVLTSYKSPFAMYSPDQIVYPTVFSGISGDQFRTNMLFKGVSQYRIRTAQMNQNSTNANHYSAIIPTSYGIQSATYDSRVAFTPENNDVKNTLGFSTFARFQTRQGNGGKFYYVFRNKYNNYMGVRLDANITATIPEDDNVGEDGVSKNGLLGNSSSGSFIANFYRGTSQRSALAVQQTYQNTDGIRYYPISEPMYWDDTIENADPNNLLEDQLDSDRKITLFGGDCYITYTLRKLYNNYRFSDPDVTDTNDPARTGEHLAIINEGNYNASIRSSETVDLTEGERKFPFQYVTQTPDFSESRGIRNSWRQYYLTESAGYNKGYNKTDGDLIAISFPLNTPFFRTRWYTRVWASAKHIPNSFENGYRRFFAGQYRDYGTENGPITKIINNNGIVYCIQEKSIGRIAINERVETAGGIGGDVFIKTGDILSPLQIVSDEIGSKHMKSIIGTDNGVYGYSDRGIIWKVVGRELRRISDLFIRSFLDERYVSETIPSIEVGTHNIVAVWNKAYDEVIFTFYTKDEDFDNERTFTVQFNELTQKIHSFYGFLPIHYFNTSKGLYSFPLKAQSEIWIHDSKNVPYNNFYGEEDSSIIGYSVNPFSDVNKEYQNKEIISNNTIPDRIEYLVQGAKSEQELSYIKNDIVNSNCRYRNEVLLVKASKITEVHNQDIEQEINNTLSGATSLLQVGSRIKGKYMICNITYETDDLIEIQSVNTIFKVMK